MLPEGLVHIGEVGISTTVETSEVDDVTSVTEIAWDKVFASASKVEEPTTLVEIDVTTSEDVVGATSVEVDRAASDDVVLSSASKLEEATMEEAIVEEAEGH